MSRDDQYVPDEIRRTQIRLDGMVNEMIPTIRWLTVHQRRTWRPLTDVYETDEAVVVKVEIAGVSEKDVTISLSNRNLTISGVRHDLDRKSAYQQLEIPYGHFRTEVFLPYAVDHDQISATYENGFLTVRLPRVKPHDIEIVEKAAHKAKQK